MTLNPQPDVRARNDAIGRHEDSFRSTVLRNAIAVLGVTLLVSHNADTKAQQSPKTSDRVVTDAQSDQGEDFEIVVEGQDPSQGNPEQPDNTEASALTRYEVRINSGVNIRDEPSLTGTILPRTDGRRSFVSALPTDFSDQLLESYEIADGIVTSVSDGFTWIAIRLGNGTVAWVAEDLIEIREPVDDAEADYEIPKPEIRDLETFMDTPLFTNEAGEPVYPQAEPYERFSSENLVIDQLGIGVIVRTLTNVQIESIQLGDDVEVLAWTIVGYTRPDGVIETFILPLAVYTQGLTYTNQQSGYSYYGERLKNEVARISVLESFFENEVRTQEKFLQLVAREDTAGSGVLLGANFRGETGPGPHITSGFHDVIAAGTNALPLTQEAVNSLKDTGRVSPVTVGTYKSLPILNPLNFGLVTWEIE